MGQRLVNRYDGTDDTCHDLWMFMLSRDVAEHVMGWEEIEEDGYGFCYGVQECTTPTGGKYRRRLPVPDYAADALAGISVLDRLASLGSVAIDVDESRYAMRVIGPDGSPLRPDWHWFTGETLAECVCHAAIACYAEMIQARARMEAAHVEG